MPLQNSVPQMVASGHLRQMVKYQKQLSANKVQ